RTPPRHRAVPAGPAAPDAAGPAPPDSGQRPTRHDRAGPRRTIRRRGPAPSLELQAPVLLDEVMAERVVRPVVGELETGPLVDPPGPGQYVVGPQHDLVVSGAPGESGALLDEAGADSHASCGRLDQKEPELRHALALLNAEDAAGRLAVDLGD